MRQYIESTKNDRIVAWDYGEKLSINLHYLLSSHCAMPSQYGDG